MDAHPFAVDVTVVVVVLLVGWVQTDGVGLTGPVWEVLGGTAFPLNVVTAAALLLRRRRPVLVLAIAVAGAVVLMVLDQGLLVAPLAVAVHSLAVHRSTRSAAVGTGVVTVAVLVAAYAQGAALGRLPLFAITAVVVALVVGSGVGERRRYTAALIDRAAALAEERDQRARLEVAAERSRIARELHDVVAHGLSVIVRLSDGADAVAESDPARSREAVRQVGRVGRDSLRDMRRLLGVLSEDGLQRDLAPQPGLADLDALIDTYRAAGLPVVVQRTGDAALDAATQLVVYRTVQEGLTNALRYARLPGRVLVRLHLAERVEVEVADDGAGTDGGPSVGSGRGLVGLRERAALYSGTVEAGPRQELDGRGWRLLLQITAGAGEEER